MRLHTRRSRSRSQRTPTRPRPPGGRDPAVAWRPLGGCCINIVHPFAGCNYYSPPNCCWQRRRNGGDPRNVETTGARVSFRSRSIFPYFRKNVLVLVSGSLLEFYIWYVLHRPHLRNAQSVSYVDSKATWEVPCHRDVWTLCWCCPRTLMNWTRWIGCATALRWLH